MHTLRIPAFTLAALLAAAPLATCLVAVRAKATTAMASAHGCDTPRSGETPSLCGARMIIASAPAVAVAAPMALVPAGADALGRTAGLASRATHRVRDPGPLGARPPAWLRHSAFLI